MLKHKQKEVAQEILAILYTHNYEGFLVGGCVRDLHLGIEPQDYDVATNAPAEFIKETLHGIDISKNM